MRSWPSNDDDRTAASKRTFGTRQEGTDSAVVAGLSGLLSITASVRPESGVLCVSKPRRRNSRLPGEGPRRHTLTSTGRSILDVRRGVAGWLRYHPFPAC